MESGRYWLQTLGCPKNQVDSEKLAGSLERSGLTKALRPEEADLLVVNTCAFIEAARQESVEAVLELADVRRRGARLVLTGCMAQRYGDELAAALPEVDLVAGFGVPLHRADQGHVQPVALGAPRVRRGADAGRRPGAERRAPHGRPGGGFDLLELPRPPVDGPWAYVKVAEGCDRRCGFCAIPSFRGPQRSRDPEAVLEEVSRLVGANGASSVREIVLVAQDLVSYGRDRHPRANGPRRRSSPGAAEDPNPWPLVPLVRQVARMAPRTRLLYLYPSGLSDELVETILGTGVPYFDLSLQHVSRPLLTRMRRWGDGERFLARIAAIRRVESLATFRSSFIIGYPGETEDDHDRLLEFLRCADLDWAGFFPFSPEVGTAAAGLADQVPAGLAMERLRECTELQDTITARRRDRLVGETRRVLVDAPGVARSVHEAPEIDGVVRVPTHLPVGALLDVVVTASLGTDVQARPVADRAPGTEGSWRSGNGPAPAEGGHR